jgi:hypothetical protein
MRSMQPSIHQRGHTGAFRNTLRYGPIFPGNGNGTFTIDPQNSVILPSWA